MSPNSLHAIFVVSAISALAIPATSVTAQTSLQVKPNTQTTTHSTTLLKQNAFLDLENNGRATTNGQNTQPNRQAGSGSNAAKGFAFTGFTNTAPRRVQAAATEPDLPALSATTRSKAATFRVTGPAPTGNTARPGTHADTDGNSKPTSASGVFPDFPTALTRPTRLTAPTPLARPQHCLTAHLPAGRSYRVVGNGFQLDNGQPACRVECVVSTIAVAVNGQTYQCQAQHY